MSAMKRGRLSCGGHWSSRNRTRLSVIADGPDCTLVVLNHGNRNSDDLWYVTLDLSNTRIGRWVNRAYWFVRETVGR